jgi:hypothetical protein
VTNKSRKAEWEKEEKAEEKVKCIKKKKNIRFIVDGVS